MFGNRGFEVYVGDLDPSVTEQLLYNSFARFGMISSIKIMRHIVTHRSRGFGFVTFFNQQDGERAIQEMHRQTLLSQKIKVYSKFKFNSIDRNSNLLLLNLPMEFEVPDIEKMCVNYGGVFSIQVLSQEVDPEEAPKHNVTTRRRAYLQFEKVGDAIKFKKEFHGTEIKGNKIVAVFTHLQAMLSVKGMFSEGVQEKIMEAVGKFGKCEISELKMVKNKSDYIATILFEDPECARTVYLTFRSTKNQFPFSSCFEPVQSRKKNFNIYPKKERKNYCRLFFDSEIDIEPLNAKLKEKHIDFISGSISPDKQGKFVYEIIFKTSKILAKFIFELENGRSCINEFLRNKKPEIEYPRFLIKTLKANRWNKANARMNNAFHPMYNMGNRGMNNPMNMNMGMNMNMNMNMGMYNNMMQQYGAYGMMNPMQMQMAMQMNMNMMNQQMNMSSTQNEISGLEVILSDIEGFKKKEREEQNKLFMDIMSKKMLANSDARAKDEEFMKLVGDFFLDDSVLDIDERLTILADNKRIVEFLDEVVKD